MLTWPAGNGWLVNKLQDKVRAKLRLGLAVADIAPGRDAATSQPEPHRGHGHRRRAGSPGFMFGGARAAAAKEVQGIHFAHTDLSGVSLFEEAFQHGICAADEALAAVRGTPT